MSINPHERPEPMLRHFGYHGLPEKDQTLPRALSDLAHNVVDALRPTAERAVVIRKLLEAKDALLRALADDAR